MFEFIGAVQDISERARAAEALRTSELLARGQVETLKEILNVISTDLNPDKFLQHILCTIAKQMGGQSVSVFSRNNDDSQTFELSCDGNHIHIPDEKVVHPTDDQPLWAEAMRIGTECLITEFDRDPIWFRFVNRPVSEGVPRINEKTSPVTVEVHRKLKAQGNALSLQIPMVTSGRVSGFVGIRFTKRREFKPEEIDLSRALAHQAAFALELMRLSRESRQTAIMGERNRMARDIHDTLAQGFTGVIMQLEAAKGASTQGNANEVANRIDRAEALARSSLGEARRSVRALRPKELRDGKLCEALENLFKRMTDGTDINAEFHTEGSVKSVPAEYEEALLRIAQESLTNALKHSGAKFVKGTLRVEGDKIQFQFVDSGKGFHPQGDYDGFGLIGMKERVEGMGGEFIIRSKPGEGTEIVVELKIENADKQSENDEQS
jgi:signal transduction histidine kinase